MRSIHARNNVVLPRAGQQAEDLSRQDRAPLWLVALLIVVGPEAWLWSTWRAAEGDSFPMRHWLGGVHPFELAWLGLCLWVLLRVWQDLDRRAEKARRPTLVLVSGLLLRLPGLQWALLFAALSSLPALLAASASLAPFPVIAAQVSPLLLMSSAFLLGFLFLSPARRIALLFRYLALFAVCKTALLFALILFFPAERLPVSQLTELLHANVHLWLALTLWCALQLFFPSEWSLSRLWSSLGFLFFLLAQSAAGLMDVQAALTSVLTILATLLIAKLGTGRFQGSGRLRSMGLTVLVILGVFLQANIPASFQGVLLADKALMNFDLLLAIAKAPLSGFGYGLPLPFPHGHEMTERPALMSLQNPNGYLYSWATGGPFVASGLALVLIMALAETTRLLRHGRTLFERQLAILTLALMILFAVSLGARSSLWNGSLVLLAFLSLGASARALWKQRLYAERSVFSFGGAELSKTRIKWDGVKANSQTNGDVYGD